VRQTTSEPLGGRKSRVGATSVKGLIGLAACVVVAVVVVVAAIVVKVVNPSGSGDSGSVGSVRYLGVYQPDAPHSYADIDQFAHSIGRQPNLVSYYSSWGEPFQLGFATSAAKHGALTLVQMDGRNISLADIAAGHYDGYLRSFAAQVKAFGRQVVLSFDHEMNGNWYSWGYEHTPAAEFIAAWRNIVTVFRQQGATNVTWMWTINIMDTLDDHVALPGSWWPGSAYVNWVGIDGYYYSSSVTFAPLFGPTIADVREFTHDPILIAETGAAYSAGQSAKISDMFAGVSQFGLLGLVLFDQDGVKVTQTWRINNSAAYAALRRDAKAYMKSLPATDP
jgi:mannan endo-1,4-beta-mannosidase